MVKINRRDGSTLTFDLEDDASYSDLSCKLANPAFLSDVTGIGILHNTFWHALTMPRNFDKTTYTCERVKHTKGGVTRTIGEKIICHTDNIRLTLLVYYNLRPKMARMEIKKVGKQRFIPEKVNGTSGKENQ